MGGMREKESRGGEHLAAADRCIQIERAFANGLLRKEPDQIIHTGLLAEEAEPLGGEG
jgi:hypothetical protein